MPYAPLWENVERVTAELQVADALHLQLTTSSANEEHAARVRDTLLAGVTLAKNVMMQSRPEIAKSRTPDGPLLLGLLDVVEQLLENVKLTQSKTDVAIELRANGADTGRLVAFLLPAVQSARDAARRTTGANNLKQLGLAFHNFYDTHQRFPTAVLHGPNAVPRSWRVELLPFLDAAPLYAQYRQDEPWDSEHNKKLLAQMPPVYRSPNDDAQSTNTSYFVVTGPGSIFDGDEGTLMQQITDGTSNTLLAVEAKRAVPWTKPEDIPFSADKPVPAFGGWYQDGFHILLGDGSVRFTKGADDATLRLLITKDDGRPVQLAP
jgi:hypothetical protein